jgi:hypothetical protein
LQTEALLHGTFALQATPYGQMADWAWGNGSQHVWGLGVGLVRLPFEAAAKTLGTVGFPDRITLALAFVAVSLLCARAFASAATTAWERFALALPIVSAPAFVILCRTRLAVYEESVAYAHLFAVAMLSLLLRFATQRRDRDLLGACALAGVAPLFRPTLAFDAGVTVALAVALGPHRGAGAASGRRSVSPARSSSPGSRSSASSTSGASAALSRPGSC